MIFHHIKETEKKESKSVRISSKKQINQGTFMILIYAEFLMYFYIYVYV